MEKKLLHDQTVADGFVCVARDLLGAETGQC